MAKVTNVTPVQNQKFTVELSPEEIEELKVLALNFLGKEQRISTVIGGDRFHTPRTIKGLTDLMCQLASVEEF